MARSVLPTAAQYRPASPWAGATQLDASSSSAGSMRGPSLPARARSYAATKASLASAACRKSPSCAERSASPCASFSRSGVSGYWVRARWPTSTARWSWPCCSSSAIA